MGDNVANFIMYFIIGAWILSNILFSSKDRFIKKLGHLLNWTAIFFLLLIIYSYQSYFEEIFQRVKAVVIPGHAIAHQNKTLEFKIALDGHFHIIATVNGVPIEFLVDSGASDVILSLTDARKIGIDINSLNFDHQYSTANGIISAAWAKADISIEQAKFPGFLVSVNSSNMDNSLLGMSLISKFNEVRFEATSLFLSY